MGTPECNSTFNHSPGTPQGEVHPPLELVCFGKLLPTVIRGGVSADHCVFALGGWVGVTQNTPGKRFLERSHLRFFRAAARLAFEMNKRTRFFVRYPSRTMARACCTESAWRWATGGTQKLTSAQRRSWSWTGASMWLRLAIRSARRGSHLARIIGHLFGERLGGELVVVCTVSVNLQVTSRDL